MGVGLWVVGIGLWVAHQQLRALLPAHAELLTDASASFTVENAPLESPDGIRRSSFNEANTAKASELAAYMNQERAAQQTEKNYLRHLEKERDAQIDAQMEHDRLEAQRNELNSKVRHLREELSLLQEPGSYVGEVVKAMGKTKVLVKVNPEGKYVVDLDKDIDINKCTPNTRVALRNDSYTLHKILPTKVDPLVSLMKVEKVPDSTYDLIGGVEKQIREIKEVIELPIKHPELFESLGVLFGSLLERLPNGRVLLVGLPGMAQTQWPDPQSGQPLNNAFIAAALRENSSLVELDLFTNSIGAAGAESIAAATTEAAPMNSASINSAPTLCCSKQSAVRSSSVVALFTGARKHTRMRDRVRPIC